MVQHSTVHGGGGGSSSSCTSSPTSSPTSSMSSSPYPACVPVLLVEQDLLLVAIRLRQADIRCFRGSYSREVHPEERQRLSVPCSGPTSRGVPVFEQRTKEIHVLSAPRHCYHDGTLVRGSTGLHTYCGSVVRSASPSGDRATTAQLRNLERASEVAKERERFY